MSGGLGEGGGQGVRPLATTVAKDSHVRGEGCDPFLRAGRGRGVAGHVGEDAGAGDADPLAGADGREVAALLAHLDEIGLDHQVVRGIVGAAVLQRSRLVRVARHHGLGDVLVPGTLEIEEHDDAVAQTVGGQHGDLRGGFAHGAASVLAMTVSPSRSWRGWRRRRCRITLSGRQRPALSQSRPTKITAGPTMAWLATQSVSSASVLATARSVSRVAFSAM